jgi:hypothetical protein
MIDGFVLPDMPFLSGFDTMVFQEPPFADRDKPSFQRIGTSPIPTYSNPIIRGRTN